MTIPRRLFVVAAHPDDDTIGCGGLMASVAAAGGAVRVCYLTSGSMSHPGSVRFPPSLVARIRESEAREALRTLGVRETPEFFALPDSELDRIDPAMRQRTVERLAESMLEVSPDAVVAPWLRDPHPDHRAASTLTRAATHRAGIFVPLAGYDVWLSIRGDASDLPAVREAVVETHALTERERALKRAALFCHASQTSDLIDDAADGFRITAELAERWLGPVERFFVTSG